MCGGPGTWQGGILASALSPVARLAHLPPGHLTLTGKPLWINFHPQRLPARPPNQDTPGQAATEIEDQLRKTLPYAMFLLGGILILF